MSSLLRKWNYQLPPTTETSFPNILIVERYRDSQYCFSYSDINGKFVLLLEWIRSTLEFIRRISSYYTCDNIRIITQRVSKKILIKKMYVLDSTLQISNKKQWMLDSLTQFVNICYLLKKVNTIIIDIWWLKWFTELNIFEMVLANCFYLSFNRHITCDRQPKNSCYKRFATEGSFW